MWEFLKSICVVRSGGYIEVKPQYFEQIPIPGLEIDSKNIDNQVDLVIKSVDTLQKLDVKFRTFFTMQLNIKKITKKLIAWHTISFQAFIKELKKVIKREDGTILTKKDEFEWLDLFEENKKKAQDLQAQIDRTEAEIDQMVYELYGLTEEEIQIVENS